MHEVLRKYVRRFAKLRRGVTKYGPAPHKPVLLLAVIRGIEEGWISSNRIELSPQLVGTFKTIWQAVVTTSHSPQIAQPFFYMRGERFWHHVANPGYEHLVKVMRNCKSIGLLQQAVEYARFDPELFELVAAPESRAI